MSLIRSLTYLFLISGLVRTSAHHIHHDERKSLSAVNQTSMQAVNPVFSVEEMYKMTRDFLDSFIFPENQKQVNAVNSTMFSEQVFGRVDATRNFIGRELNTEYIYGVFSNIIDNPNPAFFTLLGSPVRYQLAHWAGAGNVVSFSVINYLQQQNGGLIMPFEIDAWLTFDHNRQITQYDASFRYLQWAFDSIAQIGMMEANVTNPVIWQGIIAQKLAASICSIAQSSCNGTNEQYSSNEECKEFLTKQVRFGQTYEMGMNTLLCRMVHQSMVPIRPQVHCSHIGKSGGEYCVDNRLYNQTVTQSYFTHSDFVALDFPGKGTE